MEYFFIIANQTTSFLNCGLGIIEQSIKTLPEIPSYILETYIPQTRALKNTGISKTVYQTAKSITNIAIGAVKLIKQGNEKLKIPLESRHLLNYR